MVSKTMKNANAPRNCIELHPWVYVFKVERYYKNEELDANNTLPEETGRDGHGVIKSPSSYCVWRWKHIKLL